MKKIKFISVFVMAFAMFAITSCDNEPLEGNFSDGTENGGGNNNGNATNCADATNNLATATNNFNQIPSSDPNYGSVCNDYLTALQEFQSLCGDTSGTIQAIIDSLDCTGNPPDDCESAQAATQSAEAAYNADTSNSALCNAYEAALQTEISFCGDANGDLQAIIDGLNCSSSTNIQACGGFNMVNVINQSINCEYNHFDDLSINNVYIEEFGPFDEDLDGIDEHFRSKIYITDGIANLDASNNLIDFSNRTYILALGLLSEGTDGFIPDVYRQSILSSPDASHFSTVYSSFYDQSSDCENSVEIYCSSNSSAIFNGVASITEDNGVYDLCFQTLTKLVDNECFSGTYQGEFIQIITE